jgi:hypothetical protein
VAAHARARCRRTRWPPRWPASVWWR